MIDSGEHDAPPTAIELARELEDCLSRITSHDSVVMYAQELASLLIDALTPPAAHPAPDPDISGIDWKD